MNYFFFDIECANCFQGRGKICSFGYVITDDSFRILEQRDIPMNPRSRFYLAGRGNRPGITLAYTEEEFKRCPSFSYYYSEISELLRRPDQMIFGYSVSGDAGFLASEWERYQTKPVDFRFYDVQRILTDYKELQNTPSLVHGAEAFGVQESQEVHKSDEDARITMEVLRGLCNETGLTAAELIEKYPHCIGDCIGGKITTKYKEFKEQARAQRESRMEKLTGSPQQNWVMHSEENTAALKKAVFAARPNRSAEHPYRGKRIAISSNYEDYHFRQMLKLIEAIANAGGLYVRKAGSAHIFVTYPMATAGGREFRCYRLRRVKEINAEEEKIKIITFEELLANLGINPAELDELSKVQ